MSEKLKKEKFVGVSRGVAIALRTVKKAQKKIDRPWQSTRRAIAPTTAPAFPGSPQLSPHSHQLSQPHQNREDARTPQNLQQQRGAEIAMSRKQQPNSIESKTLITYNLKKEEARSKREEGKGL